MVSSKLLKTACMGIVYASKFYFRKYRSLPIGASINVSERCPINCDCYWRRRLEADLENRDLPIIAGKALEMNDDELVRFVQKLKKRGYLLVNLIGGEPYVRANILPRLCGVLPWTWITTSGTTPLINLTRTTHFISLDGATANTHDKVRRSPGLYDRIWRNIREARQANIENIHIHSVLNALNHHEIPLMLENWKESGLIDSVIFSTFTPIGDRRESFELILTDMHKKKIVMSLKAAKQRFGKFLSMSQGMIEGFLPERQINQSPGSCTTANLVESFRGDGKRIEPCVLGPEANCRECGCVITNHLKALEAFWKDTESLRITARLIPLN